VERLAVERSAAERFAGDDEVTIGYAGRLETEKGVLVLLEVFARVLAAYPQARLLLVGDGTARDQIGRRARELDIQGEMEITGWLTRDAAEERLRRATVQVVPSQWEEPFGLVAAEALMRGTPVVVSDSGDLAEIVQDGETGLSVAASDVDAWTEALLSLLGDASLRVRLAVAGRRRAERRFAEELWLDRFERIYAGLTAA